MLLHFIRHGETDWNVLGKIQGSYDSELNENGIKQAHELSRKILDENMVFSKIYSSKQRRARKTAEILSYTTGIEYKVLEGLEEINLGDWEGMSWSEVRDRFPVEYEQWYHNRRYTNAYHGESYDDMLLRALKAVHNIISENEEDVAIVTHSAVIMCIQCYLTNTPFEKMGLFKSDNMSITTIGVDYRLKEGLNILCQVLDLMNKE